MGMQNADDVQMVTAYISKRTHAEIRKHNVKINYLIELGLRAHLDNPQLIARVRVLEGKVAVLERVDSRIHGRIDQIQHEIEK